MAPKAGDSVYFKCRHSDTYRTGVLESIECSTGKCRVSVDGEIRRLELEDVILPVHAHVANGQGNSSCASLVVAGPFTF